VSQIFIDRPIFAWVLAIIVMLAGVGALSALPIEQYPDIAPTQVNIRASYPGASAETVENSVTQVLEQQLTGIDGLLYFSSQSTSRGGASLSVIFSKDTDPDIAQVQVQNKIQGALSRLPQDVQTQGVQVTKSNSDTLLLVGVYDVTDTRSWQDVSDFLTSNIQDRLARVDGVGDVNVFGSPHAMRIWLDPHKLAAFSLVPNDVIAAIGSQNAEVAAGEIGGQPSSDEQMLNATVKAQGRLQTAEQFQNILLKTQSDGSIVRLKDVARVEVGAQSYNTLLEMNGHPGAGMAISLSPGADAHCRKRQSGDGRAGKAAARGAGICLCQRRDQFHPPVGEPGGRGAAGSRGVGRDRDVRLPTKLARHADPGDRSAGGAARHIRGALSGRLHGQHAHAVRAGHRHRPAGG
jgi:multidrug efflux pump